MTLQVFIAVVVLIIFVVLVVTNQIDTIGFLIFDDLAATLSLIVDLSLLLLLMVLLSDDN